VEYYTKASNASHAPATASLASCYFYGTILAPPPPLPLSLFRSQHDTGKGVEKDLNKAIPLFIQAAEQGNKQVPLLSVLSSLLFSFFLTPIVPVTTQAEFRLGQCYEEGDGVDVDHALAAQYYARAAAKQLPEAMVSLGLCYKLGKGVELDAAKVRPHPRRRHHHHHHRPQLTTFRVHNRRWAGSRRRCS
jgi:TPR repeat protein